MNIGFFLEEMNFRGVVNSTYNYALYNKTILKNNSIIFYNKYNSLNQVDVIKKFKKNLKYMEYLSLKKSIVLKII